MTNIVVLQGRLTAAPELKYTPNNIAVSSFTIATDTGFGDNKKTSFITVVAWRKSAEFAEKYLEKGQLVNITGTLQQRKFIDRGGNDRSVVEIVASQIDFCGGKADKKTNDSDGFEPIMDDGDFPF